MAETTNTPIGGVAPALRLALATLAWVATLAVARFGPPLVWGSDPVAGWIAVGLNLAAGAVWIVVYIRFLRSVDELWRKIMTDALAVTLGIGWVLGFGYVVAEAAGILPFDVDVAGFSIVLVAVYLLALLAGRIRYR